MTTRVAQTVSIPKTTSFILTGMTSVSSFTLYSRCISREKNRPIMYIVYNDKSTNTMAKKSKFTPTTLFALQFPYICG